MENNKNNLNKNIEITKKENELVISLNPKIYPLEAIYGTCYVFIDRAYLFLDGDLDKKVKVFLKGKKELNPEELEKLTGEFKNELLNYSLRLSIAKNTKKIRETIVERALFSVLPHEKELKVIDRRPEQIDEKTIEEDPLGIAVPWEEKYGKKKNSH
jgi:His-Xaa-Ser system protein HxsD